MEEPRDPHQTPLELEELADLIPELFFKDQLNEWERENILQARYWALDARRLRQLDPLTEHYVRDLHRRMFDHTWRWAGQYRWTSKNLGVAPEQIVGGIAALVGDARYWVVNQTYSADEVAVRFHHRLVLIHPFPNGNGRHARLMADVIACRLGQNEFTWGSRELVEPGEARNAYLQAIRAADAGDIAPLLSLVRK